MQLRVIWVLVALAAPARSWADDAAEVSTSLFEEKRLGGQGGLTVVHPEASVDTDIGQHVMLDLGYSADAVSGATADRVPRRRGVERDQVLRPAPGGQPRHRLQGSSLSQITFTSTVGTERDYLSRAIGGAASIDLPGRNTTVGLAYSHSWDLVCDKDNGMLSPLERKALVGSDVCAKTGFFDGKDTPGTTVWNDLDIDTAQLTITQNLTPTLNMQVAVYGQILDGFQSNPYRRVRVGPNEPQEHIPDERARWSITTRLNKYLPAAHSAIHLGARFYNDTWGVTGGDVEIAYSQYFGSSLLMHFHARIYQQTAASFFKDAFFYETESTAGEYFTGDRELSPVRNAVVGAKLTLITLKGDKPVWHLFDKLSLNLKGDILILDQLPQEDPSLNMGGIKTEFLYGNSLLDAVILQLGLLGNY